MWLEQDETAAGGELRDKAEKEKAGEAESARDVDERSVDEDQSD